MEKPPILNRGTRKTPAEFTKILGLKIIDFKGQFGVESFNDENMRFEEYLNRISLCKIEKPNSEISRRGAAQLKRYLTNRND
jgi:hypothetical protein